MSETLAAEFSRKGHNSYFLAATPGTKIGNHGTPQYFVPSKTIASHTNRKFLRNFVRDMHIDVIVNQSGASNVAVFKLALSARNDSMVFSVHHNCVECLQSMHAQIVDSTIGSLGLPSWMRPPWLYRVLRARSKTRLAYAFERLAREGDRLVLLSDEFIPELRIFSDKIEMDKVIAIPNPAPFSAEADSLDKKENALLFVGRLENGQKRIDRLLQIWRSIARGFPSWRLDIVGDGPDRARLESQASGLMLERVYFHGSKDPKPFYRRAKLLALTSDFEGYGMVLVEAQALGCVPVAFECFSSIHSIIDNGKNGLIIPRFDINQFGTAAAALMKNPSLLADMAAAALEAPGKFRASEIADVWLNAFNRVARN